MSTLWFAVDGPAVEAACRRIEWVGIVWIAFGVVGFLFGSFWVVFAGVCVVASIGTPLMIVLLFLLGGLGPIVGSLVVAGVGASKRILAARLHELKSLAHASGSVSTEQVRAMLQDDRATERLLFYACELGVAAPTLPSG